jgi:hypothetical protein
MATIIKQADIDFTRECCINESHVNFVTTILDALVNSCKVPREEIIASMTPQDFCSKVRCADGWDQLRFLVCLEDILELTLTAEDQDKFPLFSYTMLDANDFGRMHIPVSIGEWVRMIICWLIDRDLLSIQD